MADSGTLAQQARQNGHGDATPAAAAGTADGDPLAAAASVARSATRFAGGLAGQAGKLAGRLGGGLAKRAQTRLTANLDDRDPDYIRENLPFVWLLTTLWHRGEVRNLGNIPEDRPVLLVGNHSGGTMAIDTFLFTLAFYTYFGVERAFYQLAHNLVVASPIGLMLRRYGTVGASHSNAEKALESGAAVLVYPGGDWEVYRSSRDRNKVDLGNRKGFIRLALSADVPIVPVVSIGGQETALFVTRGDWISKALGLDRLLRLKTLPIIVAPPWGLVIGDIFPPRLPLPAKITVEVLPPINLREEYGDDPDLKEVYEDIVAKMQDTLSGLAAERRWPVIG